MRFDELKNVIEMLCSRADIEGECVDLATGELDEASKLLSVLSPDVTAKSSAPPKMNHT